MCVGNRPPSRPGWQALAPASTVFHLLGPPFRPGPRPAITEPTPSPHLGSRHSLSPCSLRLLLTLTHAHTLTRSHAHSPLLGYSSIWKETRHGHGHAHSNVFQTGPTSHAAASPGRQPSPTPIPPGYTLHKHVRLTLPACWSRSVRFWPRPHTAARPCPETLDTQPQPLALPSPASSSTGRQ